MAFIRKIKKGDSVYLAKVESYRDGEKVRQRVIEYIGKEEFGKPVVKVDINKLVVGPVRRYADVKVLLQLADQLGLPTALGKHYKTIIPVIIAHLLCRKSIKKIAAWIEHTTLLDDLDLPSISTQQLYGAMDHLNDLSFGQVEEVLRSHWSKIAPDDASSFILDVTDTYYSGSRKKHEIPRKGKDGKISRLIQIGLIVSFENGFPILHRTYGGNIPGMKIFSDLLADMASAGIHAVVMDRGFYSEENVSEAERLGMKIIIGLKQTYRIKEKFLSKINREVIYSKENQFNLRESKVYIQEFPYLAGRLIVLYNPKLEVLKRDKLYEDDEQNREMRFLGYSLVYHNTNLPAKTVVRKYFDKDVVERSFKSLKGEIALHPVRAWLENRIDAHVKICYLSLCILALIQFKCRKLKLSVTKVLEEIQHVYKVTLKDKKTKKQWEKVVTITNQQKIILKALGCSV